MSNLVCFGDTIYINFGEFYLFANGIYHPTLYLVSPKNIALNSFRNGLFKLYPELSYKDSAEIEQMEKQLAYLNSLHLSDEAQQLQKDIENERKELNERKSKQEELNKRLFEESKGKPIVYGHKIQLFHIESQSFVSLSKIVTDEQIKMTQLELSKEGSNSMYFTFAHKQAEYLEGQPIGYDAPLKLISATADTFLTLGTEVDLALERTVLNPAENTLCNEDQDFVQIGVRRKMPVYEADQVFNIGMSTEESNNDDIFIRRFTSFQEEEEAAATKSLINGDYVRITNGKQYLYCFQQREEKTPGIFFQSFRGNYDYKHSNSRTLFQIVEVQDGSDPEEYLPEGKIFNPDKLPRGRILKQNDKSRYYLKHVVSGRFFAYKEGEWVLIESKNSKGEELFAINTIKDHESLEKSLDKNTLIQLQFNDSEGKQAALCFGETIAIPNVQLENNTMFFFGFYNRDNYLNKWLRPERFKAGAKTDAEEECSSLKLEKVSEKEYNSIFLVEGIANHFQAALDITDEFFNLVQTPQENREALQLFNETTRTLEDICTKFRKEIFEEPEAYYEEGEDILVPDSFRQSLLREFRIYDLMYIYWCVWTSFDLTKEKWDAKIWVDEPQAEGDNTEGKSENKEEPFEIPQFDFAGFARLAEIIKKVILISFKKNQLNQFYCSQWVRVPIRAIFDYGLSILTLATEEERLQIQKSSLALVKVGLSDQDLDALGQLNFYETQIYEVMTKQKVYDSVTLNVMTHISSSKAPNLQNQVRDNFVLDFLSKTRKFYHIFPKLSEKQGRIMVKFTRHEFSDATTTFYLDDLADSLPSNPNAMQLNEEQKKKRTLMEYFKAAVNLLLALGTIQSKAFSLKVIGAYTIDLVTKAINTLKSRSQHRDLKVALGDLLKMYHDDYFSVPFTKLPKQLQFFNQSDSFEKMAREIDITIRNGINTVISRRELEYILEEDQEEFINEKRETSASEKKIVDFSKVTEECKGQSESEEARIIIEAIKKELESSSDLDFKFFKQARETIIKIIKNATHNQTKQEPDLIKNGLEVFKVIQQKATEFASTEIVELFKAKFLEQKENLNLASEVELISDKWKSGERFILELDQILKQIQNFDMVAKKQSTSDSVMLLLDIILLKQDYLMSDVISQLRSFSLFDTSLFKELEKFIIIQDEANLKKISDVIRITFRLAEISREIFFCKEGQVTIDSEEMARIREEVYEHLWRLFFIIYDASKHFKFEDPNVAPEKRFRDGFEKSKNKRWDDCVFLNPEGVSRTYQKIFNVLQTYKAVLSTKFWLLDKTTDYNDHLQTRDLRLNFLISTCFVMNNKENQALFSVEKGVIRQLYNQHFMNVSCDALHIFSEMMRGNKKLLKLPVKYLYDITASSYIGTINRVIGNTSSNGYLSGAIKSLHYLNQAAIPIEIFNPLTDARRKWNEVAQVFIYTELQNIYSDTETSTEGETTIQNAPYCYFEVREQIAASIENFDFLASTPKNLNELQSFLTLAQWNSFFQVKNFLTVFEIKNLLAKYITQLYFGRESKAQFFDSHDSCQAFIGSLLSEIVFFREYMLVRSGKTSTDLENLLQSSNPISKNAYFVKVQELYSEYKNRDWTKFKVYLNLEVVSAHDLLVEYVYTGLLDLLFSVLLAETDYCRGMINSNGEKTEKSVIHFALELIGEFAKGQADDKNFPSAKFIRFFKQVSEIDGYGADISKIEDFGQLFNLHETSEKTDQKNKSEEGDAAEVYLKYIAPLNTLKKEKKEQNIKQIVRHINEHPMNIEIIQEIIRYFKREINKLDREEIVFILRLLRKYIEINNNNNPTDDPLYAWKELSLKDMKEIGKVQHLYRDLGLNEILFNFFTSKDKQIFRETVLLSLAYMYGGNLKVQSDFIENFKQDDDNKVLAEIGNRVKECYEQLGIHDNNKGLLEIFKQSN